MDLIKRGQLVVESMELRFVKVKKDDPESELYNMIAKRRGKECKFETAIIGKEVLDSDYLYGVMLDSILPPEDKNIDKFKELFTKEEYTAVLEFAKNYKDMIEE